MIGEMMEFIIPQKLVSLGSLDQQLSSPNKHQSHLHSLIKHGLLGLIPSISDSAGVGEG